MTLIVSFVLVVLLSFGCVFAAFEAGKRQVPLHIKHLAIAYFAAVLLVLTVSRGICSFFDGEAMPEEKPAEKAKK